MSIRKNAVVAAGRAGVLNCTFSEPHRPLNDGLVPKVVDETSTRELADVPPYRSATKVRPPGVLVAFTACPPMPGSEGS